MPKLPKLVLAHRAQEILAGERFAVRELRPETYVLEDESSALARVMELTGAPQVEFVLPGNMQIPGERPLSMLSVWLDTDGRVTVVRNG